MLFVTCTGTLSTLNLDWLPGACVLFVLIIMSVYLSISIPDGIALVMLFKNAPLYNYDILDKRIFIYLHQSIRFVNSSCCLKKKYIIVFNF